MQSQKIIKLKNGKIITVDELIKAAEASLKKWKQIIENENYGEKCGFCLLMIEKEISIFPQDELEIPDDSCIHQCPADKICTENLDFWEEISINILKSLNPNKFKYQAKRIQKNIDWLKEYLKELRA